MLNMVAVHQSFSAWSEHLRSKGQCAPNINLPNDLNPCKEYFKMLDAFLPLGSHCAVNRTDEHCPAVQHLLFPGQPHPCIQQGFLYPERARGGRSVSKLAHDSQGLPLHADSGDWNRRRGPISTDFTGAGKCGVLVSDQHAEGVPLHRPRSLLCGNDDWSDGGREVFHTQARGSS